MRAIRTRANNGDVLHQSLEKKRNEIVKPCLMMMCWMLVNVCTPPSIHLYINLFVFHNVNEWIVFSYTIHLYQSIVFLSIHTYMGISYSQNHKAFFLGSNEWMCPRGIPQYAHLSLSLSLSLSYIDTHTYTHTHTHMHACILLLVLISCISGKGTCMPRTDL
mgnify:CR=1 FL=1